MKKAKRPPWRPTKYSEAVNEKALAYANGGYAGESDVIPSRAGLAVLLGCARNTLIEWGAAHPDFSNTLERLDAMQEKTLLSGGLSGAMNATITKLALSNHGYSERVQQDNVSSDRSMSPAPNIDQSKLSLDTKRELLRAKRAAEFGGVA